jgi:hypothetical protein
VGEGVMWPAERRLQAALAPGDAAPAASRESVDREATAMSRAAVAVLVLLVAGTVLMVAQP